MAGKRPDLEPGISYRFGAFHYRWYDRISRTQKSKMLARGPEDDAETIKRANKARRDIIAEIEDTGGYTTKKLTLRETFTRFCEDGGKRGHLKPGTLVDYRSIYYGALKNPECWETGDEPQPQDRDRERSYNLNDYFGNAYVGDINVEVIRQYRRHLDGVAALRQEDYERKVAEAEAKGKTPPTWRDGKRRRDLSLLLLKSLLSYAHANRYIGHNPGTMIQVSQTRKLERPMPDRVVIQELIDAAPDHWKPFYEASAYLGTRPNETISLRWSDIEWRDESTSPDAFATVRISRGVSRGVEVDRPKTEAGFRTIPIPRRLERTLRVMKDQQRAAGTHDHDGLIFKSREGGMIDLDNFRSRTWKTTKKNAGMVKGGPREEWASLRLYDLRGVYLTWLAERGIGIHLLTRVGGHSDLATSARYQRVRDKQLLSIINIFEDEHISAEEDELEDAN